jgi:hypothetical protein
LVVASLTHSITHAIGANGAYAVFLLMLVDAVFPAASELVMVYGGALATGAIGGQHVVLFGSRISSQPGGYLVIATAGTLGYLIGSWLGWAGRSAPKRDDRSSSGTPERSTWTRPSSAEPTHGSSDTAASPSSSVGSRHSSAPSSRVVISQDHHGVDAKPPETDG